MSGKVIHFMTANGLTELKGDGFYNDSSPFSDFEGTIINQDEFPESSEIMLEFSNASGKQRRATRRKKRTDKKDNRERRREERHKSRLEARDRRLGVREKRVGVKEKEQETQKQLAESLNQPSSEDALLNQLKAAPLTPEAPKGMSKGLKIGLIVGGIVVIGAVAFFIIRKKNKK